MKIHTTAICGFFALLAAGMPLSAQPAESEAELIVLEAGLLELEAELDQEQKKLNERRRELNLRKLQLQLRKEQRNPAGAAETPEAAAARVALLQAHAQARKTRATWIAELTTLDERMETLRKDDGRIGAPRAFGPRAKAAEEQNQAARKQIELQRQQLEHAVLTSMQTNLSQNGSLNDAEYKWLETRINPPADAATTLDEATMNWAKMIHKMERDRRNPPPATDENRFEYP